MKAKLEKTKKVTWEQLKMRHPLWETAWKHSKLFPVGVYWKGLCPMEKERDFASFFVHPQKEFYYCFQCRKSGDVFSFIANIYGKSRHEVIKYYYQQEEAR